MRKLLKKEISLDDINADDVYYELRQKGIDMKIGVDIASLSLKGFVDKIVLISGDSDFVPALQNWLDVKGLILFLILCIANISKMIYMNILMD
ncbi:NYN domain-containing protein [Bacteroides faecis]|nr:NYN domain-containing protein [Bacteroides faecis]